MYELIMTSSISNKTFTIIMNKVYSQIIHQGINIILKMIDPEFRVEFFVLA